MYDSVSSTISRNENKHERIFLFGIKKKLLSAHLLLDLTVNLKFKIPVFFVIWSEIEQKAPKVKSVAHLLNSPHCSIDSYFKLLESLSKPTISTLRWKFFSGSITKKQKFEFRNTCRKKSIWQWSTITTIATS